MSNLCDEKSCTGCAACVNACPTEAVILREDTNGFVYPTIDEKSCISCKKCERACPVLNEKVVSTRTKAYAAVNSNQSIRDISTSGGVFTLLAEAVLDRGGVVFGASYNDDFSVSHRFAENTDELRRFCGSKYVQSDIGISYRQAELFLKEGRYVLFSGTPCQIAGLKSYLGNDYEKLICVDLICHGIPSPKVWQHYIDYRAAVDNNGVRASDINMRSKSTGWQRYSVEFRYSDKTYSKVFADDPYMYGYINDLYTRPSCFDCKFKGIERDSDFTLGDFWGIADKCPEMNDDKGTSLVFVHSEKAVAMWNEICKIQFKEVEPKAAVQWNPMAVKSTAYQENREAFFERYPTEDFEQLVFESVPKKASKRTSLLVRIKNKVGRIIYHA